MNPDGEVVLVRRSGGGVDGHEILIPFPWACRLIHHLQIALQVSPEQSDSRYSVIKREAVADKPRLLAPFRSEHPPLVRQRHFQLQKSTKTREPLPNVQGRLASRSRADVQEHWWQYLVYQEH